MYIFSVVIDKHITHNLLIEPFVKKKFQIPYCFICVMTPLIITMELLIFKLGDVKDMECHRPIITLHYVLSVYIPLL